MDREQTEKLRDQAKGGKKPLPQQGDGTEIRVVEGLLDEQDLQDLRNIARQKVLDEYKEAVEPVERGWFKCGKTRQNAGLYNPPE